MFSVLESKWELPSEGFISLKDQSIKTTATAVNKKPPPKSDKRKGKGHKDFKSKKHKGDKSAKKQKQDETPIEFMGPFPTGRPFGKWEAVETKYVHIARISNYLAGTIYKKESRFFAFFFFTESKSQSIYNYPHLLMCR